ncbi:PA14 domain-containing protein [Lewinella sp. JB7]|uniref:PA14 domain-containing protein n=1 Tax=Lewinella sp. JB7 TaxID=2962887 RepID=UPI0020C9BBD9|nr:PA14 domain-containing protein [Lewinella sp. JB7]MCP9235123.1 PA14 domain-containing protein [Lewinella sp. JB7]
MAKYVFLAGLLWLTACTTDPLEVHEVSTAEKAPVDDLNRVDLTEIPVGWSAGEGEILTASAPAKWELLPVQEAVTLAFSFRTEADTRATLLLGNRFPLNIPSLNLAGEHEARNTVSTTPGIWQDLELAYLPARGTEPPLLVSAYLNNNLIYYQEPLTGGEGKAEGPLTLELTAGSLQIANVRSAPRAGRGSSVNSAGEVDLNLPLIRYAYYHVDGDPQDVTNWDALSPEKEGYISRFDLAAIRERGNAYAIRFTGDLEIPQAGAYTFRLWTPSSTRLYIDDQLVVDKGGRDNGNELAGTVDLSKGSHRLRIDHYQYGFWNRLNVQYAYEGGEFRSLSDLPEDRAVATLTAGEVREVKTDDRPYLLRSFMNFPPVRVYDYTEKRTHVISVGEGDGPHYTYDLHNGSLLQMWRGRFVDVSDMWNGRGEPQVARALGTVVAFDGRPQWSPEAERWPDSIPELHHLRYDLDEAGRPTFHFALGEAQISDRVVPEGDGLLRTLTNTGGGESLLTQLAAGRDIRQISPGHFEVQGPGATVEVTELATGRLRMLRGEGSDRLVAELPPGEHLTYRVSF